MKQIRVHVYGRLAGHQEAVEEPRVYDISAETRVEAAVEAIYRAWGEGLGYVRLEHMAGGLDS